MTGKILTGSARRVFLVAALGLASVGLAGCSSFNLFSPPKIKEEQIIPPDQLYQTALDHLDAKRYNATIDTLAKLERQHPYSEYAEKAKLMIVYTNFLRGNHPQVVLTADRYLALYPASDQVPYVLYLKGTSLYAQMRDITRDQQFAQDAIDTFQRLIANYPKSRYAADAKENIRVAYDQLAGKEMSVGRYYEGNGQYTAAINRFRNVVDNYQTSTHVEEALYRLTESYLLLGLVNEARTSAAVLGHNYPSSSWYKKAYDLLKKEGLSPSTVSPSTVSGTGSAQPANG